MCLTFNCLRKFFLCIFLFTFLSIGFYPSNLYSLNYTTSIEVLSKKVHTYYPHVQGSIVAIKPTDTIKFSKTNTIENTIDRNKIWLAQTPQVFNKAKLKRAIKKAKTSKIKATDESYLMEKMGYKINIVEGSAINLKITFKSDWSFAEHLEKNFNEYRI